MFQFSIGNNCQIPDNLSSMLILDSMATSTELSTDIYNIKYTVIHRYQFISNFPDSFLNESNTFDALWPHWLSFLTY